MSPGKVVGRVFLAAYELLRVEQLAVGSGPHLVDHRGFQVQEYGTGDVFSSPGFAEECVEGIVTTPNGFVARHLPIRLQKQTARS